MPTLREYLKKVNQLSIIVSGLLLGAMAFHIIADVSFRYFAGRPLDGTTEIVSRYYMVSMVFLPLAYLQSKDGHIVAELLSNVVPSRGIPLLNSFIAILMGTFAVLLAWRCGVEAMRATAISEQIQTAFYFLPTWPARWIPSVAGVLVLIQSITDLAGNIERFLNWNSHSVLNSASPGEGKETVI
jgi:TRAP-type C4-dicarboxylate transport system permease small subunit